LLGLFNKSAQRSGLLAVAIEPEAIKFAHVRAANRERPLATRWWSVPCPASEQADSLQRETKEHGLARFVCTTLLEPADYQILLVEPPKVPADELKAAIRWRIKDLLEYHIDDATVDVFEVRAEGDAKGSARAMYAVATRNEVVQKRIALFQGARVPLKVIDIPEMAQRNVAALFESPDKATAMLAFSPWGGMLTVSFRGELLLTRRLEVTSVQLGQREHGDHYRERVATEITRSLDIFERQRLSVGVGELLLAPLPQDPELEQFLRSRLYVPVVPAALPQVMDFADAGEPTAEEQWEYFYLFGAALRVEEKVL
jgi:MSHA biogenesis protein MshI